MIRWSQEMRRNLYSRIVREIGRHKDWDRAIRPFSKRREYDRLLFSSIGIAISWSVFGDSKSNQFCHYDTEEFSQSVSTRRELHILEGRRTRERLYFHERAGKSAHLELGRYQRACWLASLRLVVRFLGKARR